MSHFFRKRRLRTQFAQAWRAGDWRAAIAVGELLLKETPDDPEFLNNLGAALLEAGEVVQAEASFRRATTLRENAIPYNNLGRALMKCGRHSEANAAFHRASELEPSDPQPRYNRLICLRETAQSEKADAELRRFVSEFPRHPAGLNDLGCLADEHGNREQALTCFMASVEISPHYLPARLNLIRVLCDLGRFPEAVPHLQILAASGMQVRVDATDALVEIDLNGQPFYRGPAKKV